MCRLCSCQKTCLGFVDAVPLLCVLLITLCGYVVPWSVVALGNRMKKEDENNSNETNFYTCTNRVQQ